MTEDTCNECFNGACIVEDEYAERFEVQRCDSCKVLESDEEAAEVVRKLLRKATGHEEVTVG